MKISVTKLTAITSSNPESLVCFVPSVKKYLGYYLYYIVGLLHKLTGIMVSVV